MSVEPESQSQSMRALLRLRQLLLSGEYETGTRMSELPLVERLGVSRTPVRMALAILEHEGLLESLPTGGYAVRGFTRADIDDAIELRGILEGTAARFAAERGVRPEQLAAMHEINDELDGVVHRADYESFERYVDLNERLHTTLLDAADSPVLRRTLAGIVTLPFASPSAFVLAEAELPESREILVIAQFQHRELVRAIERREGARAERIGREHARLASRNLDVVLDHREVLESIPGAALVDLHEEAAAEPA
jgi:GntR family transcriptional regulator of vanillate catabolism